MIREIEPHPMAGFSQGLFVGAASTRVFASTNVVFDRERGIEQRDFDQAFDRLATNLRRHGLQLADIAAMTVMLSTVEDIALFRAIRVNRLNGRKPASSVIIAAGFADASECASIEVIAMR